MHAKTLFIVLLPQVNTEFLIQTTVHNYMIRPPVYQKCQTDFGGEEIDGNVGLDVHSVTYSVDLE